MKIKKWRFQMLSLQNILENLTIVLMASLLTSCCHQLIPPPQQPLQAPSICQSITQSRVVAVKSLNKNEAVFNVKELDRNLIQLHYCIDYFLRLIASS